MLTAVLAIGGFFTGFGGFRALLSGALNTGDMLMAYVATELSSAGGFYGGTKLGYPLGMDLRYFPTADHLQSSVAALIAAVSDNPFLGVNAVWALSFPATALAGLWLMRLVGLRGPLAVLGALTVTFVPFHWERTYHVWLATSYSAILAVCLAIFVGSGRWNSALGGRHRRRDAALVALLCAVIATSGIYYAVFAILFGFVALGWRWSQGVRWRDLLLDVLPVAGVVVGLALALAPAWWFLQTNPPFVPIAERYPWESIAYSGVLAYVLVPSPASGLPGLAGYVQSVISGGQLGPTSGVAATSNFGTLLTTLAWLFGFVGTAWLARRVRRKGASESMTPGEVDPGLVAALAGVAVLFFVPWGLNYLFAVTVTPQIRAWDRLAPVLLGLFVALAAVTARRLGAARLGEPALAAIVSVGLVVLAVDAVWPYRAGVSEAATLARAEQAEAARYGDIVNAAIPGSCAVLQLPYVPYPEVAPVVALGAYDHAWHALTNREKSWTFGASKATFDTGWLEQLGDELDKEDVGYLAAGGFCAVHVDLRGYSPDQGTEMITSLEDLLGRPVAEGRGGMWRMFAIPGWSAPITERNIDTMPPDVQDFYAPLHVMATDGGAQTAEDGWLLTGSQARLAVRTGDADATFGSIVVPVTAAACTARDVTVTVTTGVGTSEGTAHVQAGDGAQVTVELPGQFDTADVVVAASGTACTSDGALITIGAFTRAP